ncbi:hypothetical protein PR003_g33622 [Phytophthora rubi]|nr:hypothetical protein PR003_g33622 [Phytophthora rubi]
MIAVLKQQLAESCQRTPCLVLGHDVEEDADKQVLGMVNPKHLVDEPGRRRPGKS